MADPIGVGFVGLGATRGWACQAHVPALGMLEDFAIRGLIGSTPATAEAAAQAHGVPFATDRLDALLDREDIDLVVVTIRVPEHALAVSAALRAGKAVLCEWPLASSLDEALSLQAIAAQAERPCFIGLQGRASPALRFASDLIAQGQLGEVLSTSLIADGGAPWGRDAIDRSKLMYQDDANGATVLTIPFGHLLDSLQQLLGPLVDAQSLLSVRRPQTHLRESGEPVAITAPDQVCVSGRCRSGVVANLHYRTGFPNGTRFHWEINGTAGSLLMRSSSGHFQFGRIAFDGYFGDATPVPLPIPDTYWPLAGDRQSQAYNVALAYAAIARDLRQGTTTAPRIADAVALHRTLTTIHDGAN